MNDSHYIPNRVLKLNVGYLLSEGPGYSRVNSLEIPSTLKVADDLTVDFLTGLITMSRTSRGLLVQAELSTRVHTECVRCMEDARVDLIVPVEEIFVYPPEPDAEYLIDESGMLDLAPLIREETLLGIPKHVLCQPDCLGLCPECGANRNDGLCACEIDRIDPRLAALKGWKDQRNQPSSTK